MPDEQKFKVFLSFKDEATGKFIKATEEQIAAIKKLGITVKKEGAGVGIDMDKMGKKMEETGRHTRFLGQEIGRLAGSIGSIRNIILVWMFALRPLINLIRESTEAARQQEDAERRLAAAFAATGTGSRAGANAIIEQASALQTLTGASDNEIISAASILATFKLNEQQIQRLLPLLVDMTALVRSRSGEEMNLASVAKATGQAFSTSASRLEYLGITLDATTKKTKDFDTILGAIEKSVGGAAQAMATTFSGQMKILNATMGDYRETLGGIITQSPYFISLLKIITGEINKQNEALKESRRLTDNFAQSWKAVLTYLIALTNTIRGFWDYFLQGIRTIVLGLYKIIEVGLRINALLIPGFKELAKTFEDAAKLMVEDMAEATDKITHIGEDMINQYVAIELGTIEVIKSQKEGVKGLVADLEGLQNVAGTTFNAMQTFMTTAVTGMRDTFVDIFIDGIRTGFKNLKDIVASFGDMMLKTIMQIAVNMMFIKIGLGSFLGFPGGLAHTGGLIYADNTSYGMPRRKFHSGGEVPATLLEGEYVMNRNAVRGIGVDNLDKLNRGEAAGGTVINNYYIQTIDERSFRERLQQHGDIYTGASERGIRDNTSLRKTSQRFG
jgi:hypothetical protein